MLGAKNNKKYITSTKIPNIIPIVLYFFKAKGINHISEIEKYLTKRFVGLKPTPINDNNKPRHAIERKTFSIDLIFKVLNRIETRYNNIPHN